VARSYRDTLSPVKFQTLTPAEDDALGLILPALKNARSPDAAAALLDRYIENHRRHVQAMPGSESELTLSALEKLKANGEFQPKSSGRMYEVDIHADPERFLDWDKPLSAQPAVANALSDVGYQVPRNFDTSRLRELAAGDPQSWYALQADFIDSAGQKTAGEFAPRNAEVSQALADRGVPGIRYLDGGSRATGDGSRNYVVFNDRLVEILRKYGLLGPVAGGAAASALAPQDAPQQQ
jgi:hypothetical protein